MALPFNHCNSLYLLYNPSYTKYAFLQCKIR